MKWFGRSAYTPVNGAETEDLVEVDQISFTSSCSSGDNDTYTSARNSATKMSNRDLISFDDDDEIAGPSLDMSLMSDHPENKGTLDFQQFVDQQPTTSSEVFNESALIRNALFWFNDDEADYSKLKLPISNRGRVCRFDHDVDDDNLETLCRSLQITMGLTERSRYLNLMAKDPELADLAKHLDDEFPMPDEQNNTPGTSRDEEMSDGLDIQRQHASSVSSFAGSGSFKVTRLPPDIEHLPIQTTSQDARMVRIVVPSRAGIDAIEIRRRCQETPEQICGAVLKQAIRQDTPADRRMNVWMTEFATNPDSWIADIKPATRKHDQYAFEVPTLSEDWILHIHKQQPVRQAMEQQQWKCASCRQTMTNLNLGDKDTSPRFCEYYGFYFCSLCHGGEKSILPAKVMKMWNFGEAAVCDRAYRFLRAVRELPVFRLRALAPDLIKKNKSLRIVIELRNKLKHMEQFIKMCDLAAKQITENGNLATIFASLDRYLLESDDLFSLNDLLRIYNKDLVILLEPLAKNARNHILKCERCSQRAHVCVKCNDITDRLFPFEERVSRCQECGALSHLPKCPRRDVPKDIACPKCARISKTRSRQRILAVGEIGDV